LKNAIFSMLLFFQNLSWGPVLIVFCKQNCWSGVFGKGFVVFKLVFFVLKNRVSLGGGKFKGDG
jgi:hypothetical protein